MEASSAAAIVTIEVNKAEIAAQTLIANGRLGRLANGVVRSLLLLFVVEGHNS